MGADRAIAQSGPGTRMVALGLWRDLFSIESAGPDRRRAFADLESGNGDDARRDRCVAATVVGGSHAARIGTSLRGSHHRRWSGLDLELGRGPFCGRPPATGSVARAAALVGG